MSAASEIQDIVARDGKRDHAEYSASSAHRWATCPGSIALARIAPPEESSAAASEGTLGHAIVEWCLERGADASDLSDEDVFALGASDGLLEAVQVCLDYARSFKAPMRTEIRAVYGPLLGLGENDAFGTLDLMVVTGATAHIIDWKFGHRYVSPDKNYQTILYAAPIVQGLIDLGEEITEVQLHIVQPRLSFDAKPWVITPEELMEHVAWLAERAQIAKTATEEFTSVDDEDWCAAYLTPDEEACRYCPARFFCPALKGLVDETAPSADAAAPEEFDDVSKDDFADYYTRIPLLRIWIDAMEQEAMKRAQSGQLPGFKLVAGRAGNRRWGDEKAAIQAASKLGVDYWAAPKIKSPAQMDKVLKKSGQSGALDEFVTRNPPKPQIAPEDDPREAWSGAASADEFD